VIGGGLAGCEAAYKIAEQGIKVRLWEMRPQKNTAVHSSDQLAELVCSNSLKSEVANTAQGLLKQEMKILGSLLLSCAEYARVPAGSALAVDRRLFSQLVTDKIIAHPNIELIREEVKELPQGEICIVATGPLTSDDFSSYLQKMTGEENMYFFDAVAPSVTMESLDKNKVFKASRYGKGEADYYNCPLTKEEYELLHDNLIEADIKEGHSIDKKLFFNGCMPIEVMARRGRDTLRFGPMRPVGLNNPKDDNRPYAVVQLRQEDKDGKILGLVGFQTRLRWGEQKRIFKLIPGLAGADFVRYGVMHRNTFINSPRLLSPFLHLKNNSSIFFAGQITGVEGYMESAATGIITGINAVRHLKHKPLVVPGENTMIGALIKFITTAESKNFQPINANFGILPPLNEAPRDKKIKYGYYVQRSLEEINSFIAQG